MSDLTPAAPAPPAPRLSIRELHKRKERGERWAMLTCYDYLTAGIFEAAGIDVLLVGDSAANTVLGYPDTVSVTVDELMPLVRAVVRGTRTAHAVKFEGGARVAAHARTVVEAGIPVMGHVGFTPQSVYRLGGYRVQGRGQAAEQIVEDALALQSAGVFAVVL